MKKYLGYFLVLLSIGSSLIYFIGRLGYYHWTADLLSHFRLYHLFGTILLLLGTILLKRKWATALNIFLCIVLFFPLIKFYIPKPKLGTADIKMASINLLSGNRNSTKVKNYVQSSQFDFILFTEVNGFWSNQLETFNSQYPYRKVVVREGNFGMAMYSKYPIANTKLHDLCPTGIPTLETEFSWQGQQIHIFGLHPEPPDDALGFDHRNEVFDKVNHLIQAVDGQCIVLGDLNCTVFSPNIKRLLKGTTLQDSRKGFGRLPTWNEDWSLISITLDHIFTSKGIQIHERSTGPNIGSDHLPAEIEISLIKKE